MPNTINVFDKDNFIKEFTNKLENAIMNMPFVPEKITLFESVLTIETKEKSFDFTIDFSKTPKENIFHIRKYLCDNIFPIVKFSHKREESLSIDEIKELLNRGITLEEALVKTKVIEDSDYFRITKVFIKKDEIFLRSLKDPTNENLYKLSMPVSILLKRLNENKIDAEQAGNIIKEKTVSIKKIYSNEEWNKILQEKEGNTE